MHFAESVQEKTEVKANIGMSHAALTHRRICLRMCLRMNIFLHVSSLQV